MAVTFNRSQLIKVAESAINAHEKAQLDHAKEVARYRGDHARDNANRAGLRQLRDFLTSRLRHGGPVPLRDARKACNSRDLEHLFYSPPGDYEVNQSVGKVPNLLSPAELTETRALLQVLRAATGDVVSANELKLLGLKNLAPVFTAAAQAAGK